MDLLNEIREHIEDFHTELTCLAQLVVALSNSYDQPDNILSCEVTAQALHSLYYYLDRMTNTTRTATRKLIELQYELQQIGTAAKQN